MYFRWEVCCFKENESERGNYFEQGDKILLPVSIQCNHALVDGIHMAEFYRLLDEHIERLALYRYRDI